MTTRRKAWGKDTEIGFTRRMDRYTVVYLPDHPRAGEKGFVLEHLLIAEKALGHALPVSAQVHHVDEDGHNNDPSNLVICENQEYHQLLHRRMRAMAGSGNPDAGRCNYCLKWDAPENLNLSVFPTGRAKARHMYYHPKRNGACVPKSTIGSRG